VAIPVVVVGRGRTIGEPTLAPAANFGQDLF
jgi:hypothetical protein